MGTWGTDAFENDEAADWLAGLREQASTAYVENALDAVLDTGADYLEVTEAQAAVAAAEVVARLRDQNQQGGATLTPADGWLAGLGLVPSPGLAAKARAALERIQTSPSELLELWDETGSGEWRRAMAALARRLEG